MRQAGRYLPEYRSLRQRHSLLELCHKPELAAQVTLQPVERLGVDAAILFADILLPFEPLGLGLSFSAGEGPQITRPIREAGQVLELPPVDPATDLAYVMEAARAAARALPAHIPLIGFAGAPFTLASYAIEGGATRSFALTKRFMYNEPRAWHELMQRFAELVGGYLAGQARAGARALQLFDSWVGCLSPPDYATYVFPHSQRALELASASGVPVIHFGTDTATLLVDFARAGGDVIGVDWRVPLDVAWERIGSSTPRAIQGNLDPVALLAPRPELERQVRDVLARAGRRPGHIFNLGQGVRPGTPVEALQTVVGWVQGGGGGGTRCRAVDGVRRPGEPRRGRVVPPGCARRATHGAGARAGDQTALRTDRRPVADPGAHRSAGGRRAAGAGAGQAVRGLRGDAALASLHPRCGRAHRGGRTPAGGGDRARAALLGDVR